MAKAKMVVDMRLIKTISIKSESFTGIKTSLSMDTDGMAGVLYVYESKRQAIKAGCKEENLKEIQLKGQTDGD